MGPSAVTAGGLLLDIAGALLLAVGLMFKKPHHAVEETTPKWGFNIDLDASLARQTADAQVGGALLVLGFVVQMLAALGWHRTSAWSAVIYATASALALVAVAVGFLFRYWRYRHLRAMLAARLATSEMGLWWPLLASYGLLLGDPGDAVVADLETTAQFGERLLGWRWRSLTADMRLLDPLVKLRRDLAGTPEYEQAHPHLR